MTEFPTHAEVQEAVQMVAQMKEQNKNLFSYEYARYDLGRAGFSDLACIPALQEIYFSDIEKLAAYYERFNGRPPTDHAPEKMAFLIINEEKYYETTVESNKGFMRHNPSAYNAYCEGQLEMIAKNVTQAITELSAIANDRKVISDYIRSGIELRKARLEGKKDTEIEIDDGKRHDLEFAAQRLNNPYDFEVERGQYLVVETARRTQEAELLKEFKAVYAKALKKGYVARFLAEFDVVHNSLSNVDLDFETIAMKNGGIELMHEKGSLRADGYQMAFNNMSDFTTKIKDFSGKPIEIRAEKRSAPENEEKPARTFRLFKWF